MIRNRDIGIIVGQVAKGIIAETNIGPAGLVSWDAARIAAGHVVAAMIANEKFPLAVDKKPEPENNP